MKFDYDYYLEDIEMMEKDQNKVKALESAIAQIEKQYGKGSVM